VFDWRRGLVVEAGEGLGGCVPGRKLAPVWVTRQSGSGVGGLVCGLGGL
jgi:hypothetical protein